MQIKHLFLCVSVFLCWSGQQAMGQAAVPVKEKSTSVQEAIKQLVKSKTFIREIIKELPEIQPLWEALGNAQNNMQVLLEQIDDTPQWPKYVLLKRDIFFAEISDAQKLQDALTLLEPFGDSHDTNARAFTFKNSALSCKQQLKISSPAECIALFMVLQKLRNGISLDSCSICFESLTKGVQLLKNQVNLDKQVEFTCGHRYHVGCITSSIEKGIKTCPNCRKVFVVSRLFVSESELNSVELLALSRLLTPDDQHSQVKTQPVGCCCHFMGTVRENPILQFYIVVCAGFLVYLVYSGARIPMM